MRRGQTAAAAAARRTTYLFNRRFHTNGGTQYPWCSRSLCWVGGVWEYAITKLSELVKDLFYEHRTKNSLLSNQLNIRRI